MQRRRELLALAAAALIIVLAGSFFFYVDDFNSADQTRVEEPYKRTADKPPSAVPDETSSPELKD